MAPVRGYLEKRNHDEGPRCHPRMREGWRPGLDQAPIVEEVEIERPRTISRGTSTAKSGFRLMQQAQQRLRVEGGFDLGNGIEERRVGGVRPSLGLVKGRSATDTYAVSFKFQESRLECFPRAARFGREIGTECDQDCLHGPRLKMRSCAEMANY